MKSKKTMVAAVLVAGLCCAGTVAAADEGFDLDVREYAAGVRQHGLDGQTRVLGWRLSDDVYFGRRHGSVDDFGFVMRHGATQFSFTQDGIGWRRALSQHH